METLVLTIHILIALGLVITVLLQRSEGGGLGIGGGGGGMGGLASPEGTKSLLTRATGICAACFFVTSLTLGVIAGQKSGGGESILDALDEAAPAAITAPVEEAPVKPSVPIAE
jgi:preprotein translocase subunit SecG